VRSSIGALPRDAHAATPMTSATAAMRTSAVDTMLDEGGTDAKGIDTGARYFDMRIYAIPGSSGTNLTASNICSR
jgi:hypothetical protein